ncbi:alpha/beta hydrolase-fold protein [Flavihumibacter solisilvae]|uniref:CBM20 domain-containing protein n=1 Tax=Flavihumibacter solisilvae TaxID=1349421 RepID=A0A0C1KZA4_9BACT|nr:alpha/beta hydrolase-fold protein [Flavihumibacter solisilvae]KIC93007.1 hypothetical protein OI18_19850 [Flavihumibacter solisilvae]
MKRLTCLFLIISVCLCQATAQYKVVIRITSLPASPQASEVFIAGDFNNWNPSDPNSRLQKGAQGLFFFEGSNVPSGTYVYKFTRGSWETVETNFKGQSIDNRTLTITSDTMVSLTIEGWQDAVKSAPPKVVSTASPQVRWLDTAFAIPQLERSRRIWIYLPANYDKSAKRYPVLYLHDGQNLFDAATSFAGEWGVDETLDSSGKGFIVVGIDNGGLKRMNEYNPNDHERFGKGEGREYLAFLARTLKPYIDRHYRTKSDLKHTSIAGSSMGGLISFYAGILYPDVFGNIGVFSPSFWIDPSLDSVIGQKVNNRLNKRQRYYFYAGQLEGQEMVPDTYKIANHLERLTGQKYPVRVNENGRHNEPAWRQEFPRFIEWLSVEVN